MEGQSKNTIKTVFTLFLFVLLGEGVLGWGVYWPFLLLLLNRNWIFWLALAIGVLVSVLHGLSIGLPSLFILIVVGGLSLFMSVRKEMGWVIVVLGVVCSVIFDLVFGLNLSVGEVLAVILAGFLTQSWFKRSEAISVSY